MLADDKIDLCKNAWDNFNQPMEIKFLEKLK